MIPSYAAKVCLYMRQIIYKYASGTEENDAIQKKLTVNHRDF